jgi:single-stranded-DNA-specific exonuclease
MEKVWQILPAVSEDFISQFPEYNQAVLQILWNRGFRNREEIDNFFGNNFEKIHDPFLFNQMEEAVEVIIKNIKAGNRITIFGDYDADGVTSTAVLYEILEIFKADASFYIPDRFEEGIGLNKDAIKKLKDSGTKLIITVDCGIVSYEEVEYAKSLGLEIIITDHHTPREDLNLLPKTIIINPLAPGEKYPFKKLAGVGVAQKLKEALISKSKLSDEMKTRLINRSYDLVAVGLVADCMSVLGENRLLLKKGMSELNQTTRTGLKELIKIAGLNTGKELDSWNIGFQLAPRINAAGRLVHADKAVNLLITKDIKEAQDAALSLNELNSERQRITSEIVAEAESQIEESDNFSIVCVSGRENIWPEGVIGLVASRICEKYHKPTLIITRAEEGLKGSGRSIEEFNIIKAIEECSPYLEKYGGHPGACGFSLKEENYSKFKEEFKKNSANKLINVNLSPNIKIDAEIKVEDISEELTSMIEKFAPFGVDNFRPKFLTKHLVIKDIMTMGADGQHIKFRINSHWAVAFGQSENWKRFQIGDLVDVVYYLEINEFNGRRELQMKLVDIKEKN